LNPRPVRIVLAIAGLVAITVATRRFVPVNATTVGFAYLLIVLVVASTWGFIDAAILSIAATVAFNFFFLAPVGTLTIADPQNWVALFTFLTTSLIASRLSTLAKRRASDAIERQQDIERLYAFSRAILLIEGAESFPAELIRKLAEIFQLDIAVLYDRRTGEFYRAGPFELQGLEAQLQNPDLDAIALSNDQFCILTAIRLGAEPIGSLAIKGSHITDSILQGIANLVAIGLERARAQLLAHQIEAAKRSDQLRTTLIDAMAHEFKTPLTSIRATTTLLLDSPDQATESRMELLKIADEEAQHLGTLIDDTVAMARLDTGHISVDLAITDLAEVIDEVVQSLRTEIQERSLEITREGDAALSALDRTLIKLALKQLIENALKYSMPGTPIRIRVRQDNETVAVEVTDQGRGIPIQEQKRIFERFYRSPRVQNQIPGSGLGLSIAQSILLAHGGDLTVTSRPGETTFRMLLPGINKGEAIERGSNSHS
jgi:two-component system, OmpR family, sensor histidine kinase KdpD